MAARDRRSSALQALAQAKALDLDVRKVGLRGPIPSDEGDERTSTFDEVVDDDDLIDASRPLFLDGHYASAVLEAFKCLNDYVKETSGIVDKDGAKLMTHVFSASSPTLALNDLGSVSQRDEQTGYMQIFAGAMTGIRNPRAHEHAFDDDPTTALELLGLANHLMRVARRADLA